MFLVCFMTILCVFHFPVSSDIAGLPNCGHKDDDTQRQVIDYLLYFSKLTVFVF